MQVGMARSLTWSGATERSLQQAAALFENNLRTFVRKIVRQFFKYALKPF
jgi:hypothetical protein